MEGWRWVEAGGCGRRWANATRGVCAVPCMLAGGDGGGGRRVRVCVVVVEAACVCVGPYVRT